MPTSSVAIGAACLNQTPLGWYNNKQNIESAIAKAKQENVKLLCCPELCITGYGCEDAFLRESVPETSSEILAEILPFTKDIAVVVGLPVRVGKKLYNSICVIANQKILGFCAKQFLASDGIHYESRWFSPWERGQSTTVEINGTTVPFGDCIFDFDGIRIGFEICEDAWQKKRPARYLVEQGVRIILNPSASHFAFGKLELRKQIVLDAVSQLPCAYVFTNLIGNEAGRIIYDGGTIFAWNGSIKRIGSRLSFKNVIVDNACFKVDTNTQCGADKQRNVIEQSLSSTVVRSTVVRSKFSVVVDPYFSDKESLDLIDKGSLPKEKEFPYAVSLGLFDYLRKSKSQGFVVSLSGGVDSSAVVVLCRLMVVLAVRELDTDGFAQKLSHIPLSLDETSKDKVKSLVTQLLTCVYQSTRNSSEVTLVAARAIAKATGAKFYEWNVDDIVESYTEVVKNTLNIDLTWETHDIALQNIQARVRGPGIWMLANIKNALLLTTSNRSEAAVGYTTMDGDTCGSLSPIAGIDKTYLQQWLRWFELEGISETGAYRYLQYVNEQQPTAELRPSEYSQTDESDLMPYIVLDRIEELAIKDRLSPKDIVEILSTDFPSHTISCIAKWVERFFKLWSYNQWKRERYAPCFHLDDENLDPKTWCRFPILSGAFSRELESLKDLIDKKEVL